MSNPSVAAPHDGWSEVRASDQVIRYRRQGAGRPVLVLQSHRPDQPDSWLMAALAGRFRLLVPELPAARADVAARLALFLDGLGMTDVAVVAFGDLCLPALELALLGGDQVGRLALVMDGQSDLPELDGALVTGPGQPALPLVLIRDAGGGTDDASLVRFLAEAAPEGLLARPGE
jgi:hypothetical protein